MITVTVTESPLWVPVPGVVKLTADQLRRRKAAVEVIETLPDGAVCKLLRRVQFKVGESFGYDGSGLPKSVMAAAVPDDPKPASKPRGQSSKPASK